MNNRMNNRMNHQMNDKEMKERINYMEELIKKLPRANMVDIDDTIFDKDSIDTFMNPDNHFDINTYCCIKIVSENLQEEPIYIIIKDNDSYQKRYKDAIRTFKSEIKGENVNYVNLYFDSAFSDSAFSDSATNKIYYLKFKKEYENTKLIIASESEGGGKKKVVKYTVKQLQAIASKNNIKITKKVDGKTVRLNKKGLMTKLKRYKLI